MSTAAHVLLALLAAGPMHGYDLKKAHDQRLPQAKPIAFGQVYGTLGRLERDGLVEKRGQSREGGPDRTEFAITDTGREKLRTWLETIETPAPYISSTLLAKVVVALLVDGAGQARDYLTAQRRAHTARLRELTAVKTDPASSPGDVIAADYAIAHLDADLRWLRTTLERVADLHREVRS
ncbi:PadR family transcriptional regulator [Streptomyces megasporus]|uniref:PadR family transcriptional regulator n=1 Tax=Streptomyces megasporus TaxID=44060 RepID=UPI0004E1A0B6|nr:PadR family transcriptional regulator [Streptomyces megasporus]